LPGNVKTKDGIDSIRVISSILRKVIISMEKIVDFIVKSYNNGSIDKNFTKNVLNLVKEEQKNGDIAIIGMSIKAAGIENLEDFWNVIECGKDCIREFPENRKSQVEKYAYAKMGHNVKYLKGAYLDDISSFDYKFFKCSPKEASLMDPNQRVFLETAWKALENSGYANDDIAKSRTGIFLGYSPAIKDSYIEMVNMDGKENIPSAIPGNLISIIASRLAYYLDLRGPAMIVDTACSSGLVAIDVASRALTSNDCDIAIVGGVKLHILPIDDDNYRLGIESDDGHTRAFDKSSTGTGIGEGSVAVVLKRLSDAERDKDNIYAVLKGIAANQDGKSLGITAPNPEAQEDVIIEAWKNAGISPETISYIEAHGTGTKIGDTIEINSITRVFKKYTDKENFCAVGSIKSNLGHLYECAGLASFVKAVLALNKRILPKTINVKEINPEFDLDHSAVYINTENRKWDSDNCKRRCGVSSFGFSGTNAHAILEEYDGISDYSQNNNEGMYIAVFSAESIISLQNIIKNYVEQRHSLSKLNIETLVWNLSACRKHYSYRLAIITKDIEDLLIKLETICNDGLEGNYPWKFFAYHKIVGNTKDVIEKDEITYKAKESLNNEVENHCFDYKDIECLEYFSKMYCRGTDIHWRNVYNFITMNQKYSLPEYVFNKETVWLDSKESHEFPKNFCDSSVILKGKEDFSDIEIRIANIVSKIMGFDEIDVYDDLLDLGMDSIQGMDIIDEIKRELQVDIGIKTFMQGANIIKVANEAENSKKSDVVSNNAIIDEVNKYEKFGVTNIQRAYIMGRNKYYVLGNVSTYMYLEYETEIDLGRFEQALNKLIKKHPMLRAVLYKNLQQQILEEVPYYKIDILDLKDKSLVESEKIRIEERNKMSHQIFDIETWPLFDVKGIVTRNKKYILFGMDMLIADGFSLQIMVKDLLTFYYDESAEINECRYTFRDYINEYALIMNSEKYLEAKNYWAKKIGKNSTAPVLPLKNRCEDIAIPHFSRKQYRFGKGSLNRFKEVVSRHGVTVSSALATIYAETLRLWSTQQDFIINVATFNRYGFNDFVNELIGDFTAVMLLKIDYDANLSFWEKAKYVQNNIFEGIENRYYDGVEVINDIITANGGGNTVKFPVVFTCIIADENNFSLDSLGKEVFGVSQTPQVYLDNQARAYGDELISVWDYIDDIFNENIINTMFEYYNQLIYSSLLDMENMKLDNYVDAKLFSYNDTFYGFRMLPVIELFYGQVKNNYSKTAIIFDDKSITYNELDEYSNIIANYLISNGVKKGNYVAVLTQRDIESIINIIGVLKAGAAYVPIDTEYPLERRNYIFENNGCKMLLESGFINSAEAKLYPADRPVIDYCIYDIMYTIYTSGSTGLPKGVVETQEAVLNTILDINRRFNITEEDVILGVSSLCFDLSVYDVFATVILGATLVIVDDQRNIMKMVETIREKRVTIWNSVPAIMNLVAQNINFINDSIRIVMLSGDWIPLNLPEHIHEHFTNAEIISLGGATEGAIWSIYFPIDEVKSEWNSIPYGMPLANQKMYVLNTSLKQCPVDVEGEICIGGVGVALEYCNDAVKTEAAFINHPEFGYIYRTGDFGVFRKEGYIEFLGRRDSQVKVNGYRVELGEIEAKLLEHEDVLQAVVLIKNDKGKAYICAYMVCSQNINKTDLKNYLGEKLPAYMIPNYFIQLEKIPITSNGKLDRKELLSITLIDKPNDKYTAPESEREERLVKIFEEILEVERIGVNDSFFDMGGNSLNVMILMSRIYDEFQISVPIKDMFEYQTVRELIRKIDKQDSKSNLLYEEIKKAEKKEYYETSAAQKRMYTVQQMDEKNIAYNLPACYIAEGEIDEEKIKEIFKELILRHEALRTVFMMKDEEIVQQVIEDWDFSVEELEVTEDDIKKKYKEFVRPFDLGKGPLIRLGVGRLDERRCAIFIDIHHIVSDGVSIIILLNEFAKIYLGQELEKIELTYKDYSEWSNQIGEAENINNEKEYWKEKYRDEVQVLNLPTDYARGERKEYGAKNKKFKIDAEIVKKIDELCKSSTATEYMVLLSALNILLSKYSGQEDIVVGSPIAGRRSAKLQDIVGMFVNTLAIRSSVRGEQEYGAYLQEFKKGVIEDFENQDYQFDELVKDLNIGHEYGRNPLFDVMFSVQDFYAEEIKVPNLKISQIDRSSGMAKFDLVMVATRQREEFSLEIEYATDLYTEGTIDKLFVHYLQILNAVASNPDVIIKDIDILTDGEKRVILEDFNDTAAEYPHEKTIIEFFEERVDRTPDRIAVQKGKEKLTYRELNARANIIAHRLREMGVGCGDYVALLCIRSIEMIVGIYGILKAGAAYVPIDPNFPEQRIKYIIDDCQAKVAVVYKEGKAVRKIIKNSTAVLDLTERKSKIGNSKNPVKISGVDSPFYLIYTSGTTGNPKGVTIRNNAFVNLVNWYINEFGMNENDTVMMVSSVCFDLTQKNIIAPIQSGAKLYVYDIDNLDYEEMAEIIKNERITWLNCAPSAFYPLVLEDKKSGYSRISSLRKVFLGGEAINCEKLKEWLRCMDNTEVINAYGPTECTDIVSCYRSSQIDFEENQTIPIGKPLPNTKLYILNNQQLCGIGIPGELCVAGVGVSTGYINNPKFTSERFIDNPFGEGKIYRTGDLAKWRPDGNIMYLGRIDEQVKIRGIRIELGEIESVIRRQSNITNCAVIARKNNNAVKIYAYIVADQKIDIKELKNRIREELPDYMIPSYMMQIDEIPVTRNGKLDKRALPDIQVQEEKEYEAPSNKTEEIMAAIFAEVLGVDRVSVSEDFFDLGGDSIKIVRAVSKLREAGIQVSAKDVLSEMTIKKLALVCLNK